MLHKLLFEANETFLIHYTSLFFWALVNTMCNKYPQQRNKFNKKIIKKIHWITIEKKNTIKLSTRKGDCLVLLKPNTPNK